MKVTTDGNVVESIITQFEFPKVHYTVLDTITIEGYFEAPIDGAY